MKEGATMSESDSTASSTLPGGDIPASWGFHLLRELRRIEDRLDSKFDTTNSRIDALEAKMDNKIDTIRREMDTKIEGLRYWSWISIITVLAATITLIALHF